MTSLFILMFCYGQGITMVVVLVFTNTVLVGSHYRPTKALIHPGSGNWYRSCLGRFILCSRSGTTVDIFHIYAPADHEASIQVYKNAHVGTVRDCPTEGCGAVLQKNGGCNHMRCTVCNTHFCWLCGFKELSIHCILTPIEGCETQWCAMFDHSLPDFIVTTFVHIFRFTFCALFTGRRDSPFPFVFGVLKLCPFS
uniref:IBR domain-containing protein n=1 Tax=Angiostrongylus cantonensis TaxID=6313 RepID=A0A0K0DPY6_ANGCA